VSFTGIQDRALAIALQADGKLVVADRSRGHGLDFALIGYNRDGSVATAFGNGGSVLTDVQRDSTDEAAAVALQADGKIVMVGTSTCSR
jgi:diaminopimelate epimerase